MKKLTKRMFAFALTLCLALPFGFSASAASTSDEMSERETRNAELSMNAATQGMVLLENSGALPLKKDISLALFGTGAYGTIKGGTGSGDVNQRYTVNVADGLTNIGYTITSQDWIDRYKAAYDEATAGGGMWGAPAVPDIEITDEDLTTAKADDTVTAVYVIARNSGEGSDRKAVEGDYYLSEIEKSNLEKLSENFETTIVVINSGGIIDTSFYSKIEGLDAMLLMSQAGMRGGDALAMVLSGDVTPSGKLTDTWAQNYEDYPSSATFSQNDGNVDEEDYTDGIYVGYRYFDTFGITPAYAFGYGLSYTDFDIAVDDVTADADHVTVTATVTNTGETYSGKEVVEVYFSAPAGELEKPYQELAAYGKTDELAPGESQTLTLRFLTSEMASYSEAKTAYLLEAGDYVIRVGNSSRNTVAAASIALDETVVTEQLSNQVEADEEIVELTSADATSIATDETPSIQLSLSAADFTTVNNASAYEDETVTAYVSDTTETQYLAENLPYEPIDKYTGVAYAEDVATFEGDYSGYTFKDVYDGTITMEQFVSGLTVEEMANIVIGGNKLPNATGQSAGAAGTEGNLSDGTIIGAQANSVAGAAGETAGIYIESKLIPNIVLADGPAGLRITRENAVTDESGNETTYYQFCTAWPIGTLLAMTWDSDLVEEVGAAVGEELQEYGVTLWLAPGMNIHRNPLCGRNFEYYSEDPFVTGMTGISITAGVQSNPGIGVTIKHYVANNQEENRNAVNNTIGERAFREIYLKAFEMVVKGARPMAIMTSYNLNNSVPAADDYDICTNLARGEWGFDGLIMTDWGGGQSTPSISMHAGNDLIMPGSAVTDITVKGFTDEEPTFAKDDCYPVTSASVRQWGDRVFASNNTEWGEFIPSADGSVTIEKTVDTEVLNAATREYVAAGTTEVSEASVLDLIAALGDAAEVVDNGDGTTLIRYMGDYEDNNITLGDLQKSTINILNIIMESNQFANLFDDVESVSYTASRADQLIEYLTVVK